MIAVDADEVRKAKLRAEPLFAVFVTVRSRGREEVSINPTESTLEFVNHYQTIQKAIDSDAFADKFQREAATLPAKGQEDRSKNLTETAQFLRSRSLRAAKLDGLSPEATGWIFFSAKSKWIGDWKAQEQFVLRVPLGRFVLAFPFALPPARGDLLLRRR